MGLSGMAQRGGNQPIEWKSAAPTQGQSEGGDDDRCAQCDIDRKGHESAGGHEARP